MKLYNKNMIISSLKSESSHFKKLGVSRIGLFGSYVRMQQNENSDVDVLVEFERGKENFDNFMNLCFLLDDIFTDKKVEVITANSLSPYIAPHILKEVEYVQITS